MSFTPDEFTDEGLERECDECGERLEDCTCHANDEDEDDEDEIENN